MAPTISLVIGLLACAPPEEDSGSVISAATSATTSSSPATSTTNTPSTTTSTTTTSTTNTSTTNTSTTGTTVTTPPAWCPEPVDGLQDITTTDASPYFVFHPLTDETDVPTIVFLPGGSGERGGAAGVFQNWIEGGDGQDGVRAVVVYADDGNLTDEFTRTLDVVDEVLACWGGDSARVHIGGTSNGGRGAFDLMLDAPDRFATLLGAPGVFSSYDAEQARAAFKGKRVYNGVGEDDTSWQPYALSTHPALGVEGVDSIYVEFVGEGHVLSSGFDTTVFFDFWLDR